jgi:hypothetical protein
LHKFLQKTVTNAVTGPIVGHSRTKFQDLNPCKAKRIRRTDMAFRK